MIVSSGFKEIIPQWVSSWSTCSMSFYVTLIVCKPAFEEIPRPIDSDMFAILLMFSIKPLFCSWLLHFVVRIHLVLLFLWPTLAWLNRNFWSQNYAGDAGEAYNATRTEAECKRNGCEAFCSTGSVECWGAVVWERHLMVGLCWKMERLCWVCSI